MSRLLVIGAVWPEPRSSAAGSHILQVLRPFLTDGWEVTYASTATDTRHAVDLSRMGIRSEGVAVNDPTFDDLLRSLQPDVVLFDRFFIEEQFGWRVEQTCPNALRVLNCEDLHFLREARGKAAADPNSLALNLNTATARREVAAIFRSDLSFLISEVEIELLESKFQIDRSLLHYSPFMIDVPSGDSFAEMPDFEERRDFFTVGHFRHPPNGDAVRWLKNDIWPLVRKRLPAARLSIAGAYATADQMKLNAPDDGFFVEGRIDEVDPRFMNARVCLAPLRFGAGLKGKMIDAMRNGTPIVTTPVGAEGIPGSLPWPGAIAKTAEAIAASAAELYSDPDRWIQAQTQGAAILTARFDRRAHEPRQMKRIAQAREAMSEQRDRNFVGAMLRDHHHRSTRYLSLWIEAKNQLV